MRRCRWPRRLSYPLSCSFPVRLLQQPADRGVLLLGAGLEIERLPGAAGGLGQRLYRAAMTEASVKGIVEQVKTKRYTDSRIRRMLCCAALGIDEDMQRGEPPYARVLAADPRGRAYLSSIRGESRLPILTKPAAVHQLGLSAEELFSLGAKAHDLFALGFSNPELRRGDADWRKGPTIL